MPKRVFIISFGNVDIYLNGSQTTVYAQEAYNLVLFVRPSVCQCNSVKKLARSPPTNTTYLIVHIIRGAHLPWRSRDDFLMLKFVSISTKRFSDRSIFASLH